LSLENLIIICEKLKNKNRLDLALRKIQTFLKKDKANFRAYIYAGVYAHSLNKIIIAEEYFRKAIQIKPDDGDAHFHYAIFLQSNKRFVDSLKHFRNAYKVNPNSDLICVGLGRILQVLGEIEEAMIFFKKTIDISPLNYRAKYLLGISYLRLQDFNNGWDLYNYRHEYFSGKQYSLGRIDKNKLTSASKWKGQNLNKKALLIVPEQGHGDNLMCFRYIHKINDNYDCQITLICHNPLKTLFINSCKSITVYEVDEAHEKISRKDFDYWVPFFDLPMIFCRSGLQSSEFPYLQPFKEELFDTLKDKHKKNIGIVWRGNPKHANDDIRSIPSTKLLNPLLSTKEFNFISLHNEELTEDFANFEHEITSSKKFIKNFNDLANLILDLDLIISVDTSIVHLSGALNKKCWVIIPEIDKDWRWFEDKKKSPWYPSLEIFTLNNDLNWKKVIDEIRNKLSEEF